ncbi:UNVERIFIED_CONTAM: hypothetical protein K2H54_043585 [Gekko kuhli]
MAPVSKSSSDIVQSASKCPVLTTQSSASTPVKKKKKDKSSKDHKSTKKGSSKPLKVVKSGKATGSAPDIAPKVPTVPTPVSTLEAPTAPSILAIQLMDSPIHQLDPDMLADMRPFSDIEDVEILSHSPGKEPSPSAQSSALLLLEVHTNVGPGKNAPLTISLLMTRGGHVHHLEAKSPHLRDLGSDLDSSPLIISTLSPQTRVFHVWQ